MLILLQLILKIFLMLLLHKKKTISKFHISVTATAKNIQRVATKNIVRKKSVTSWPFECLQTFQNLTANSLSNLLEFTEHSKRYQNPFLSPERYEDKPRRGEFKMLTVWPSIAEGSATLTARSRVYFYNKGI